MTLKRSIGLRNASIDSGFGPAFDGGSGRINVYTGAQPADAETAASGTLLATLTLASDAVAAASGGAAAFNSITADSAADASGTPGWARFYRTGDTAPGSSAGSTDRRMDVAAGPKTQLNGAINNSVTTLTVDSSAGFGNTGTLIVDSEQITYTGRTGTTFTGCTRGANGTTAASHSDNVQVAPYGVELLFDNTNFVSDGFVAGGQVSVSSFTYSEAA